jgi:uncharacterized protein (DUF2141 family)
VTRLLPPIVALTAIASVAYGQEPSGGELVVVIPNVHSADGKIRCALYRSSEGFPDEYEHAMRSHIVRARRGSVRCVFRGLEDGRDYAVALIHDEDDDLELDTNLFGVPSEGYGVSNNAEPETFGPPTYTNARFVFRGPRMRLRIRLRY